MKVLIDGPLIFGDPAQIRKIRAAEREEEMKVIMAGLPVCRKCEGSGLCGHCQQDCPECDGAGKVDK